MRAQARGFLLSTWGFWAEFLDPGFDLAQTIAGIWKVKQWMKDPSLQMPVPVSVPVSTPFKYAKNSFKNSIKKGELLPF